jgi:hypothetical protein
MCIRVRGKSFTIKGKVHKVKFDRSHKWWKLIDLKSMGKSSRIINSNYKLVPKQIDKLFNGMFLPKYRNLFNEKTTIIDEAVVRQNHTLIQIPPNYPIKSIVSDINIGIQKKKLN